MQLGFSVAVGVAQALATASIRPLAWELLYDMGAALRKKKGKKIKKETSIDKDVGRRNPSYAADGNV